MPSYVQVLIPPLPDALTYSLPEELAAHVTVGYRVLVPLGSRKTFGFVISKSAALEENQKGFKIKDLLWNENDQLCFHPKQLEFFKWVAEYYGEPLSNVIDVAVPGIAPRQLQKVIHLLKPPESELKSKAQSQIVEYLVNNGGACDSAEITRIVKNASVPLKKLAAQGVLEITSLDKFTGQRLSAEVPAWATKSVQLSLDQQGALAHITKAIEARSFETFLLHGVTGSGKTEVYIEAILAAKQAGLQSLVIVPEIALTPQLVDRFRARFGDELALLHSALSQRTRWEGWRSLVEGLSFVAIGTRSGIFAPLEKLGLIIVDEEHDHSFKQGEGLRYNARDIAVLRAKLEKCPVVLGSATPSMETYHNALTERYKLLPLVSRPLGVPPLTIELEDLNLVKPWDMPSRNVSPKLYECILETLSRKQQTFVLYNRRGFASYLQCSSCEAVVGCPNCSVTMTYHQSSNALVCHYCSLNIPTPRSCPQCIEKNVAKPGTLKQRGAGTEKIFDELKALFPSATVDRLDRDTAAAHDDYRRILNDVRSGKTDILVGTQMIAKGHDLPGVTLVGIADCDVGLHMPDFRAAEKVFQLLTQASGRAGRSEAAGRVLLQTRVPKNLSIIKTIEKDYQGFAKLELKARKLLRYPPFSRMLRVIASASNPDLLPLFLTELRKRAAALLKESGAKIEILGPAPAPLEKIKTLHRFHLLFKAQSRAQLNTMLLQLKALCAKQTRVKVVFDLDPYDML